LLLPESWRVSGNDDDEYAAEGNKFIETFNATGPEFGAELGYDIGAE